MKNLLLKLFPFESYEIVTQLTKEAIFKRLESAYDPNYPHYTVEILQHGFTVAERSPRGNDGNRSQSPFSPVANASIDQRDDRTAVAVNVQINPLGRVVFFTLYVISALLFAIGLAEAAFGIASMIAGTGGTLTAPWLLIPLPAVQLLGILLFKIPAKRMRSFLEHALA